MLKTSTIALAAVAVFGMTQLANAQVYSQNTHFHSVPHTTTHTDFVRHGNHIDAIPHTTTHVDRVPHTTIRLRSSLYPQQYYGRQNNSRQSVARQIYVPHTTTHLDRVRHGNHSHVVPHTTTHFDRVPRFVPHTTTHFDRVRHGNHSHVVPHTTTHWDRR